MAQVYTEGQGNATLEAAMAKDLASKGIGGTKAPSLSPAAYDPSADIAALKEAQKKQAVASLDSQRKASLSALGAEQAKLSTASTDQRNATSTASQIGAKNFAEYMAQRGQNRAGANNGTMDYANIARNVQLQGDIGGINKTEMLGNQDIGRRTTLAEDTYNSGMTAADAAAEAQATQLLMQAKQHAYDQQLQQFNSDRTYNYGMGRDNVADTRYDATTTYNQGRDALTDKRYDETTAYNKATDSRDFNASQALAMGYVNPTAITNIPDDVRQQLAPYAGNYAEAAQQLTYSNPTLAKYAQALSNEKMFSDANLLKQYGQPFMTQQAQATQSGIKTDEIQRATATLNNLVTQYNLDNIMPEEVKRAKQLYSIGEAELAAKLFENTKAPEAFKAKMDEMAANIRQSDASATASLASAAKSNSSGGTEKKSPYYDSISKQVDTLIYGMEKDPNIVVPNKKWDADKKEWVTSEGTSVDYIRSPGSVQHKQISTVVGNAVKNGLITPDEGELIFNSYNLPY